MKNSKKKIKSISAKQIMKNVKGQWMNVMPNSEHAFKLPKIMIPDRKLT